MTTLTRIMQLEKIRKAKDGTPKKIIYMDDAHGDNLATFDGVKMTQAEAEQKAAALSDSVLLIHVVRASKDKDGDE